MMKVILGPPHIYAAATERCMRSLAKWLGSDVHTLQLVLERMAAEMPSSWTTAKGPRQMDQTKKGLRRKNLTR